jgi:hypothetical protein
MIALDRYAACWMAACLLLASVALSPSLARGQGDATEAAQSNDAARETLSDGAYPWYDAEADQLHPLEFDTSEPWDWNLWNFGLFFKVLVYTLLGLVIGALVVALILYAKNWQRAPEQPRVASEGVVAPDQVEALQFLAERPRGDLLGQARKYYEQGNYSEAIIYLFSYQLLELDKFSLIQLAKGKTNRQYLREASRVTPLRSPLERTLLTFEGVFFGQRPLDRAGFEACWNELPHFEQLLRGTT